MGVRYPPPPQKGYLSDSCAIPHENKAQRVRYSEENKEHPKTQHTRKRKFSERSGTCVFGCVAFSGALWRLPRYPPPRYDLERYCAIWGGISHWAAKHLPADWPCPKRCTVVSNCQESPQPTKPKKIRHEKRAQTQTFESGYFPLG